MRLLALLAALVAGPAIAQDFPVTVIFPNGPLLDDQVAAALGN